MNDGRPVTADLVRKTIPEELAHIRELLGEERYNGGKFDLAAKLFEDMMTSTDFAEFLTLGTYEQLD